MLWFKKQPDSTREAGAAELIEPAELAVALDPQLFLRHLGNLKQTAEMDAGLEPYLESLRAKHQLFFDALNSAAIDALDLAKIELLLEAVFSARRRLFPALEQMGEAAAAAAIKTLLYGQGRLQQRMEAFVAAIPVVQGEDRESIKAAGKTRRAAYDFAAELLHFNAPEQYPLMTRWVWDQATVSGALREFIRGNDSMTEIPLGGSPEMYEGARQWFAAQVGEQGIYRDVPFWIDLVQAQAYADYFRSMAEGMLSADFGRGGGPEEYLKKFLGIDALRRSGRSRVKHSSDSAGLGE